MTYATFFRDELVVFFVINYLRNMVKTELFLMNFRNRGGKKKLDTTTTNLLFELFNDHLPISRRSQMVSIFKWQIPSTKPHYNQKVHLASLGCLNVFNPLAGNDTTKFISCCHYYQINYQHLLVSTLFRRLIARKMLP